MAIVDTVALAAADKLAATAGPKAGLAAYKTLALNVASSDARARAILGALRCAAALGEANDLEAVTAWWPSVKEGAFLREVVALCDRLLASGRGGAAVNLAAAEVARFPSARASYLHARCLERARGAAASAGPDAGPDADADAAYGDAIVRAEKEGVSDVAAAARLARASLRALDPARREEAAADVRAIDPTRLAPAQKLAWARLSLASSSRFARATALGALDEIAASASSGEDRAREAMRAAAEHVDAMGEALTPLEADRARVAIARWPETEARTVALARVDAIARIARAAPGERDAAIEAAASASPDDAAPLARARALLAGGGAGRFPTAGDALTATALDAVAALRTDRLGDAAHALATAARALRDADGDRHRAASVPAPLWTALMLGAGSSSRMVRDDALALAEVLLTRARPSPPRGFVALSAVLARAGRDDLALLALRTASARSEPGVEAALVRATAARAWRVAARNEATARAEAIRLLRDAKARARAD